MSTSAPSRLRATIVGALVLSLGALWAGPAFADTTTTAPADGITAPAGPTSPSNNAVAVNTKDGTSLFDLAFSVRQMMSGPVVPTNTAIAYASCSSCETVAIAIQLVFVTVPSDYVAPTNAAVAVNYLCNLCQTFAGAVQYVVDVPGPVHFNQVGLDQLQAIREELRKLKQTQPPLSEVEAVLATIKTQIQTLISNGLVTGVGSHEQDSEARGAETTTTQVGGDAAVTTTTVLATTTTVPAATSSTTTAPVSTTSVP